jgi:hypothetical protein
MSLTVKVYRRKQKVRNKKIKIKTQRNYIVRNPAIKQKQKTLFFNLKQQYLLSECFTHYFLNGDFFHIKN